MNQTLKSKLSPSPTLSLNSESLSSSYKNTHDSDFNLRELELSDKEELGVKFGLPKFNLEHKLTSKIYSSKDFKSNKTDRRPQSGSDFCKSCIKYWETIESLKYQQRAYV